MNTKILVLALCACAATGVASAQSGATSAAGRTSAYVGMQDPYVTSASQPKTREQVNAETRAAREGNPLLMGEMSPVPDVLSRTYGLQPNYGGQTSVGEQAPAGSSGGWGSPQR